MRYVTFTAAVASFIVTVVLCADRPCEKFPTELVDEQFKKLNLVDLNNDYASVFNTRVAKACNINYIDVKHMQVTSCSHHFLVFVIVVL